jgi:hypothetical protein
MKTFKPGEKITGNSMMGDALQPVEVTGEYLRPFGTSSSMALLIETEDGTRHVVDGNTARPAEPTQAMFYRQLADHLDDFAELDHLGNVGANFGKLRIQLYEPPEASAIAAILIWLKSVGAVNVSARKVKENWHLSGIGRVSGGLPVEVIAISVGEEAAALDDAIGGSKLNGAIPLDVIARHQRPHPAALFTAEQMAEVEHWSKTPLPGGAS